MSKNLSDQFSKEVQPYLSEIAARLWSGHAAIMVGAGFSKNAIKSDPTKPGFPNWYELGNVFYQKIHGELPDGNHNYLNLLKLADEVQAAFGRAVLDQLIKENIPDKDHTPSELHIKLLELPWADIFTTNYDTLLERATEHVLTQKYDLVINKEDLIYAKRPRIVKLHGSFPSERPLIVTEEDYRCYPRSFAPFVNTVQQSLIENTLCLVGFSGDDPNFIQWIGWIMDNLGKDNSPKIYLIGVTNMSHAQRKLLESKNIVIVNLGPLEGQDNHYQALLNFVNYLFEEKKKDIHIDWPEHGPHFSKFKLEGQKLLEHWKTVRLKYPNWLILPYRQRERLWSATSGLILTGKEVYSFKEPQDIELLYELNWRQEICLCPIFDNQIETLEIVLKKYENLLINPQDFSPDISGASPSEVKKWWLYLSLALFRYYREEVLSEKWSAMNDLLNSVIEQISPDLLARYHYEICLNTLSSLKFSQLQSDLDHWPVNETLPYWEAKRAGLIAESGNTSEALSILERSLTRIRQRLNLSPVINDYTWVSLESYVMQLLNYVKLSDDYLTLTDQDSSIFKDRWNFLKLYRCDPLLEFEVFRLQLEKDPIPEKLITSKYKFELGMKTTTRKLSLSGKESLIGYNFLRYLEETGIPPRLPNTIWGKSSISGAVERIKTTSAYLAIGILIRSGDGSISKEVLNRKFIQHLSADNITSLIDYFLSMTISMIDEFESTSLADKSEFKPDLPGLLSVLVVRASKEDKLRLFDVLSKLYHSPHIVHFKGIPEFSKRLLNSLTIVEKIELIPNMLEFPFTKAKREIDELPDPFGYLNLKRETIISNKINIGRQVIRQILNEAKKGSPNRDRAIVRLCQLYGLNQLNQQQIKSFARVLYAHTDEHGFPDDNTYRDFSFMNLPAPNTVDTTSIFKRYILDTEIPTKSISKAKGTSLTRGNIPILSDMLDGTRTNFSIYGVEWSPVETRELFNKLRIWWNADKIHLNTGETSSIFGTLQDEFKQRFQHLPKLLSKVISINSFWHRDSAVQDQIKEIISELGSYDFPCLNLKFAFLQLFESEKSQLFEELEYTLIEGKSDRVLDAVNTIIDLTINPFIISVYKKEYIHLIDLVVQQIKWRNFNWFEYSVDTITVVIDKQPKMLTRVQHADLIFGLTQLLQDTAKENDELETDPRLVYRKKSIHLARKLFDLYPPESVPKTLLKWRNVSESDDEFGRSVIHGTYSSSWFRKYLPGYKKRGRFSRCMFRQHYQPLGQK